MRVISGALLAIGLAVGSCVTVAQSPTEGPAPDKPAVPTSREAAAEPAPTVSPAEIPENTWVRIVAEKDGPWKRNYSGMCFDSTRGQVLYWGGGHFSYPGNEVQAYKVGAPRWHTLDERCVMPLPIRWHGGAPGVDPFGRPWAWHSYDDLVYDPAGDQMIWMAVGGAGGVWLYSLEDNTWQQKWPTPRPNGGLAACSAYVPDGRLVAVAGSRDDGFWLYDIAANRFTRVGKIPARPYNAGMTYDSKNKLVVMAGGVLADTWIYSIEKKQWRKADPANAPGQVHSAGLAFDSVNNVVIMAGAAGAGRNRTNGTWILDAATGKWSDPKPKAQPSISLAGIYGSLVFDPAHNVALVTWGRGWRGKCQTWAYRYRAPAKKKTPGQE